MRLHTVFAAIAVAVLVPATIPAQQKPNLTGTWKLNVEKSKLSDGNPIPYYSEYLRDRLVTSIVKAGFTVIRKSTITPDGKSITAEWELIQDTGSQKAIEEWEKQ